MTRAWTFSAIICGLGFFAKNLADFAQDADVRPKIGRFGPAGFWVLEFKVPLA
jgi:hypothetical protein